MLANSAAQAHVPDLGDITSGAPLIGNIHIQTICLTSFSCPTGRLNVLANVVRKPMRQIFSEFTGVVPVGDHYFGTGDVKYHLGTSYDRPTISGKRIHLSLLANPSHLEVRLSVENRGVVLN